MPKAAMEHITPTTAPASHATKQGYPILALLTVFMVLLIASLPAIMIRDSWGPIPFDPTELERLNKQKPDYVLIGNSTLDSRIDNDHMSALLGGARIANLAVLGSESALWYLQFKNLVIQADTAPKRVIFTFTNRLMTDAFINSSGKYKRQLDRLSMREEQLLRSLAKNRTGTLKKLDNFLFDNLFPIQRENNKAIRWYMRRLSYLLTYPENISILAREIWTKLGHQKIPDSVLNNRDRRRALFLDDVITLMSRNKRTLRSDLIVQHKVRPSTLSEEQNRQFEYQRPRSFLPEILRLAQTNQIKVAFIRFQSRPNPDGQLDQDPALNHYISELSTYLRQQDVPFYDFTGDPEITFTAYSDNDHIQRSSRRRYTEIFVDRLTGHGLFDETMKGASQ
ncbi:MAG: hypothetical protein HQL53_07630 [Magnetococcales bacterium]|nr:hypothetical protein [Magnetococcales bacterium]